MSSGEQRNAELSRAAMVMIAGAAVLGLSQSAQVPTGPIAVVALVAGGAVVAIGLWLAVRAFLRRSGGADQ